MTRYLIRRAQFFLLLLLLISMATFAVLYGLGVDPAQGIFQSDEDATVEDYMRLRELYGLDQPIYLRYFKWIFAAVQGDFGYSSFWGQPVIDLLVPRLGNTLLMTGLAFLVAVVASLLIGIYSAVRQYSIGDHLATFVTFLGFSIPQFWFGLMLISIVGVSWGILPTSGAYTLTAGGPEPDLMTALADRLKHIILPCIVIGLPLMAEFTRYVRSSMLDVINQDYIRTARAKGLRETLVLSRHALRNALIPFITIAAWTLPATLNGSIAVETVFAYPGLGKLTFDAIIHADYQLAVVVIMLMVVMVVLANLLADVICGIVDPRIQYE
jgi:peptide/nickel transport system permease protein